jgi:serine/threonine-protein kinase HipA
VSAHSFVGGARSKAVVSIDMKQGLVYLGDRTKKPPVNFIPAIIKYDDTAGGDENKSTYSKLEYIYHLLAKESGIKMMDCFLIESNDKHHFVTKRFDIENGEKLHVHSLAGILQTDYNITMQTSYEELLRVAVKLNAQGSIKQLFLQMLFNYMFVNQDDHSRNFSFMCDKSFNWEATPAYDITFAKGEKQTVEHQLSLYGKALSKINLSDVVLLANEFSISVEFVSESIEKMQELRKSKLPKLMQEYKVSNKKYSSVMKAVMSRDFQGELSDD